jgi:hypothetical protein
MSNVEIVARQVAIMSKVDNVKFNNVDYIYNVGFISNVDNGNSVENIHNLDIVKMTKVNNEK